MTRLDLLSYPGDAVRGAGRFFAPLVDLGFRLWLGQLFLVASLAAIAGAPDMGTRLYACYAAWPQEDTVLGAVVLGASLASAVGLAIGVGVRLAALVLIAGLALSHFGGEPDALNLVWLAMLGWLALHGGGAIALDRALGRGAAESAAPLSRVASAFMAAADKIAPAYLTGLRLALAAPPILLAFGATQGLEAAGHALRLDGQAMDFMTTPISGLAGGAAAVFAGLFAVGLFTRGVALAAAALALAAAIPAGLGWEAGAASTLALLFFARGPGLASLDGALGFESDPKPPAPDAPRVVILGAGFAGLSAAKALTGRNAHVTLVDASNHHLFQPLLYQVATAALSPADIATPIRELFRGQPNVRTLLGRAADVDKEAREVVLEDRRLPYDYLVVATGARHAYFGNDQWAPYAPGLKTLDQAVLIRNRLLTAFEKAEHALTEEARQRWLTFVIVGGGPTGVELAGAVAELARHGMAGEFRHCDPAEARILLVDRGDRPLRAMSEQMSAITARELEAMGVELLLGEGVDEIDAGGVRLSSGERIEAGAVLWAAGVAASPAGDWLGVETDRAGRVPVGPTLEPEGCENIFVVGDVAAIEGGRPVPGIAPAAKQAGAHAAGLILQRMAGRRGDKPFRYDHLGDLATIGRKAAVVDMGRFKFSGPLAWWLWGAAHVYFLTGLRNRASVAVHWLWSYLTYRRPTRIITQIENSAL
ncbi:MAG: FAD-dependent oxidoreductase [Pseudomonadota bacterium]